MKRFHRLLLPFLVALCAVHVVPAQSQMLMRDRLLKRDSLQQLSDALWQVGEREESILRLQEICALFAPLQEGANHQHATALYLLGNRQQMAGHAVEGVANIRRALEVWRKVSPIATQEELAMTRTYQLAARKHALTDEAVEAGARLMALLDEMYADVPADHVIDIFRYGKDLYDHRDFAQSREVLGKFLFRFLDVFEEVDGEEDLKKGYVATALTLSARSSYELEDFGKAQTAAATADTLLMNISGQEMSLVAVRFFRGLVAQQMEESDEALHFYAQAEALIQSLMPAGGDGTSAHERELQQHLMRVWQNKALILAETDLVAAMRTYEQIFDFYIRTDADMDDLLAGSLANLAMLQALTGNLNENSLSLADTALDWLEANGYGQMQIYLEALSAKAFVVLAWEDEAEVEAHARKMQGYISSQLAQRFPTLTEAERTTWWNKVSGWYTRLLPNMLFVAPTDAMVRLTYDGILQSKGILLASTVSVDRLLQHADRPELESLRQQWQQARSRQAAAAVAGEEDAALSAAALAQRLEKRILREAAAVGNFMDDFSLTAQDVQLALHPGDAAVEFFCASSLDDSDSLYLALVLTRDMEDPLCVPLFTPVEMQRLTQGAVFGGLGTEMYDLVWRPILDAIGTEVDRIFFAADGMLYNLPIEYCATPEGGIMAERFLCHRMTSTRVLAQRAAQAQAMQGEAQAAQDEAQAIRETPDAVLLFGDIDYSAPPAVRETPRALAAATESIATAPLAEEATAEVMRDYRGAAFTRLKGTRQEIHAIDSILLAAGIPTLALDSARATKQVLRSRSDGTLRLLHFATHGIYVAPAERHRTLWLQSVDASAAEGSEDEMLTRSALVLAGANGALRRENPSTDGILTAREIASLNLDGLQLATLSACETGRGDISGDGVFGLQRGFKKAGAESLLMSLLKVDDRATALFMREFYAGLADGHVGMHRSLLRAIRAVRSADGGRFDAPRFWAPFILLDALD